jgi:hypothetical protein
VPQVHVNTPTQQVRVHNPQPQTGVNVPKGGVQVQAVPTTKTSVTQQKVSSPAVYTPASESKTGKATSHIDGMKKDAPVVGLHAVPPGLSKPGDKPVPGHLALNTAYRSVTSGTVKAKASDAVPHDTIPTFSKDAHVGDQYSYTTAYGSTHPECPNSVCVGIYHGSLPPGAVLSANSDGSTRCNVCQPGIYAGRRACERPETRHPHRTRHPVLPPVSTAHCPAGSSCSRLAFGQLAMIL